MEIDIKHIAELAFLDISDDEADSIADYLCGIIGMMSELPEYDEGDITSGGMELREDTVISSELTREELMSNAPQVSEGCFAVPRTVQ